jgi:hypothetical protein
MRPAELKWNGADVNGTSFRGMLSTPWSFEETVARLKALSGQDPTAQTDEYKVSVEFEGTFRGDTFTLYDYKGDNALHIGGTSDLDVAALQAALVPELWTVTPAPYTATIHYAERGTHGWPNASSSALLRALTAPEAKVAVTFVEGGAPTLDKATLRHIRDYIDALLAQ